MVVVAERIPVDYVVRTVVHVLVVESALAAMVVNTEADFPLPISQLQHRDSFCNNNHICHKLQGLVIIQVDMVTTRQCHNKCHHGK
jgi:hypothetical protein